LLNVGNKNLFKGGVKMLDIIAGLGIVIGVLIALGFVYTVFYVKGIASDDDIINNCAELFNLYNSDEPIVRHLSRNKKSRTYRKPKLRNKNSDRIKNDGYNERRYIESVKQLMRNKK
jgi:hypothetical protein